ncbi:MAG: fluoride efflux transporter CrcB [Chitinophagaceae bacterium]|nr:fluoride efflux transporter CrcB [Chitinophagaceae bacterium]
MMYNLLLVGLGGAIGSIARYLGQRWLTILYGPSFPWGTFAVNAAGCLLIGIFWGISFKSFNENEHWKLFLMTGLCGGFTTFSAFTLEGIGLLKENKPGLFFLYVAASVLTGLLATWLGMKITR